jgi:hypothetical protein
MIEEERASLRRKGIVPSDYPGPVAADYPDLVAILESRVKPERAQLRDDTPDGKRRKTFWWLWGRWTPTLAEAQLKYDRLLAISYVSQHMAFAFLPTNLVYAITLAVLKFSKYSEFSVVQSRVHETWARFFASSLEDRLRYTSTDCFETFPLPSVFGQSPQLDSVGQQYYDYRADIMRRYSEGLTTIYNWFHDPESDCMEITRLRKLHDAMDRAVLNAYDWTDIQPKSQFILEFDNEEEDEEIVRSRKKKYRYRWADDVRDEVLARLLQLNRQRALEEGQVVEDARVTTLKSELKSKRTMGNRSPNQASTSVLFTPDQEEV